MSTESDQIYRERARLVAFLATQYKSEIWITTDPREDGWPLIFIETPAGQLSWHLSVSDLDLFMHVPKVETDQAPPWDGHTTQEKYGRLAKLTRQISQSGARHRP